MEQQLRAAIDEKGTGGDGGKVGGKGGDGGKAGKGGFQPSGWLNKAAELAACYGLGLWEKVDEILDGWRRHEVASKRIKIETRRLSLLSGNARPLALSSKPPPEPPRNHPAPRVSGGNGRGGISHPAPVIP